MLHQGVQLSILAGPMIPVPVPSFVVDSLISAKVQINSAKYDPIKEEMTFPPTGIELEFNLGKKSPLETIFLVNGSTPPFVRIVLVVTINGRPEPIFDGFILNNKVTPGNGSNPSKLTLRGEDISSFMNFIDFSGFPFPGSPITLRVLAVIGKYAALGLVPITVPPLQEEIPDPSDRIKKQKGSDLAFLHQLAREAGYVFYIEPGPAPGMNKAYWGPEIKIGKPQAALNLDMDALTNVESMSFEVDHDKAATPIVWIRPDASPVSIPVPVPSISLLSPPLGLVPPMSFVKEKVDNVAQLSFAEAFLKGLSIKANSAEGVTAQGSLNVIRYGRLLKARQLVGVRGAGMAFDGLYYVRSVSHEIKRGEYKQSFELSRNGLVSTVPRVPTS